MVFSALGKENLAIKELQEALRIMPNCSQAHYLLGQIYIDLRLYRRAFESLRKCLLSSPNDPEALTALARCLIGLKDNSWAKECLLKAIKIKKDYAPAYYQLSKIYLAQKKDDEAMKYLRKSIQYMPLSSRYHSKLSEVLFNKAKSSRDPVIMKEARKEILLADQLNIGEDDQLNKDIKFLLQFASVCDKNLK